MTNTMHREINLGLIKYGCQHHILCPGCRAILDVDRAVLISFISPRGEATATRCGPACAQAVIDEVNRNGWEMVSTLSARDGERPYITARGEPVCADMTGEQTALGL